MLSLSGMYCMSGSWWIVVFSKNFTIGLSLLSKSCTDGLPFQWGKMHRMAQKPTSYWKISVWHTRCFTFSVWFSFKIPITVRTSNCIANGMILNKVTAVNFSSAGILKLICRGTVAPGLYTTQNDCDWLKRIQRSQSFFSLIPEWQCVQPDLSPAWTQFCGDFVLNNPQCIFWYSWAYVTLTAALSFFGVI